MITNFTGSDAGHLGKVLVVDDEVELMTVLCRALTAQNYITAGFTTGAEALERLRTEEFDVLITDMMMPGMDGITLLKSALEIDPQLVGIVMTGQGTVQTAVEAMKQGAHDYVLKPFKLNMLLPAMSRYMETRRLRLENVQLRETMALYELSQSIAFSLDRKTILNKLADGAMEQCEADEVSVMLPAEGGQEFYVAISRGGQREHLTGEKVPFSVGIAGWVATHHESLLLRGRVMDTRFAPLHPREDIGSSISMPMLVGNKLIGVLNLNATRRARPFTLGQVKALSILVATAGTALESAWLYGQIKETEEKYRAIFENAVDGIFQSRPDGCILTANSALARILGHRAPDGGLVPVSDLRQLIVEPERWEQFQEAMELEQSVQGFESRVGAMERDEVWVSINARPVLDPNGRLLHHEGIVENITARKQAEEKQRLRHEVTAVLARPGNLKAATCDILRIIGQGVGCNFGALWMLEPTAGRPRCLSTWKNGNSDFCTNGSAPLDHGAGSMSLETFEAMWEGKGPVFLTYPPNGSGDTSGGAAGPTNWLGVPIRLGERICGALEFHGHSVREPSGDTLDLLVSLGSQIGQYVERNQAIEELDFFFTLSLDMLCVAGTDGYFKRLNPAWEHTLGYTRDELLARPYLEFVHPDDRAETIKTASYAAQGEVTLFENRYRCKDGTYKWIRWVSTPLPEKQIIYAAAHDITVLKEANQDLERRVNERTTELIAATEEMQAAKEAADAANQAKSEFLSRMSHELRTPLNAVLGFSQLLSMEELDPLQLSNVSQIIKGGKHLLDLINEILDLARIEAGRMQLSVEPVSLPEIILESLSLMKPLAAQREIRLDWPGGEIGEGAGVFVWADQQRLKQVLLNLVGNAVKYNRDGGEVMVKCEIFSFDGDSESAQLHTEKPGRTGRSVRVSVTDTGAGIAPDLMDRLFVPFDRLGAEHSRIEGTGLGLALSRRMIEAMEGRMGVASTPGQGTTFWLELFEAEEFATTFQQDEPVELINFTGGDRSILYIEDNLSNLNLVEQLVKRQLGAELLVAMQGGVGLELARQHHPDLVLLDANLPDLSGLDVLRRLKSDSATSSIPVVVLSADATPGQIERLRLAGARDYLTKPLDVRQFLRMLDGAVHEPKTDEGTPKLPTAIPPNNGD